MSDKKSTFHIENLKIWKVFLLSFRFRYFFTWWHLLPPWQSVFYAFKSTSHANPYPFLINGFIRRILHEKLQTKLLLFSASSALSIETSWLPKKLWFDGVRCFEFQLVGIENFFWASTRSSHMHSRFEWNRKRYGLNDFSWIIAIKCC